LRDLPQKKNPRCYAQGRCPQILYVPMEMFLSMKWERSKETKRELLVFGRNTIFQSEEGFNKDLPCTKIAEIN